MAQIRLPISNIIAQRELLQTQKRDFEVILTNSTRKIITDTVIYTNIIPGFTNNELQFIKKVKRDIIINCQNWENENFPQKIEELSCRYVDWANVIPFSVEDCVEIDLNAAYWHLANQLGYLSDNLFLEGLSKQKNGQLIYSKKTRLAALGTIAKAEKRFVHRYTEGIGYEIENIPVERHEYSKAFFNVSRYVYDIMAMCRELLGEDYLFFWVDAIFFKKPLKNMPIIKELLKEAGLDWKRYNIQKFTYTQSDKKIRVTSRGHKNYNRTFNIN